MNSEALTRFCSLLSLQTGFRVVACVSTNSVNWELSSSHFYDETPKWATALGWICLDNFLTGISQRLLINERRKKKNKAKTRVSLNCLYCGLPIFFSQNRTPSSFADLFHPPYTQWGYQAEVIFPPFSQPM